MFFCFCFRPPKGLTVWTGHIKPSKRRRCTSEGRLWGPHSPSSVLPQSGLSQLGKVAFFSWAMIAHSVPEEHSSSGPTVAWWESSLRFQEQKTASTMFALELNAVVSSTAKLKRDKNGQIQKNQRLQNGVSQSRGTDACWRLSGAPRWRDSWLLACDRLSESTCLAVLSRITAAGSREAHWWSLFSFGQATRMLLVWTDDTWLIDYFYCYKMSEWFGVRLK